MQIVVPSNFDGLPRLVFLASPTKISPENDEDEERTGLSMIAECVGLDIGQTAFKAVRFRRRLTGRESVEYFHLPIPYGRQEQTEPPWQTPE